MLKLLGAVLLTAGAVALGLGCSAKLSARVSVLRSMTGALGWMEKELAFRLTPIPQIFEMLAERERGIVGNFFRRCAKGAKDVRERQLSVVWNEAVENELSTITVEDRQFVADLGLVLGRYNSEDQRLALEQTVAQLNKQAELAARERDKLGRVYGTLGLSAGAFLVILLL